MICQESTGSIVGGTGVHVFEGMFDTGTEIVVFGELLCLGMSADKVHGRLGVLERLTRLFRRGADHVIR